MDVTDLDVVVPEPKRVKLGGVEYQVPADLPMELFLRLNMIPLRKNEDGTDDQIGQLNGLIEVFRELFSWEAAAKDAKGIEDEVEKIVRSRGVQFSFTLISRIYKAVDDESPPAEGQVQPDAASNGTKSSSTSRSRATTS